MTIRQLILPFLLGAALAMGACAESTISNVGVSILPPDSTASPLRAQIEVYNYGSEAVSPVRLRIEEVQKLDEGAATAVPGGVVEVDPASAESLDPGETMRSVVTLDTTSVDDYGVYVAELLAEVGESALRLNVVLQWVDPAAESGGS